MTTLKNVLTGGMGLALAATGLTLVAPGAASAADPVTLNLLNINDFHGRIDANTTAFATTVEQLRAEAGEDNTLFLSAGDNIGASLFASALQQDEPTIDVLNALELATSAVGNHEFDAGFEDLSGRVADRATFDYLGANVYQKGTTTPAMEEYATFEVAGLTVGVIGAVTETTPTIVSPGGVATLDFGDPVEAVNRVAAQLSDDDEANGEADVIVAEYHDGAGPADTLEEALADEGVFADIVNETSAEVDAIFTGHTHNVYAWDAPIPGGDATRPILQTGSYGANIGQIELSVDPDTGAVTGYTQRNVPRVDEADLTLPRVAAVDEIVEAARDHAAEVGNQPIGEITDDITTAFEGGDYVDGEYTIPDDVDPADLRDDRSRESTMGELVANALRDGISDIQEVDLGITNPGGMRNEFYYEGDTANGGPENTDGVVTYAEANAILTFSNTVAIVELTGAELVAVLEQQWPSEARTTYLQLGLSDNVNVIADPTAPAGSRIKSVRIDGKQVRPGRTYKVSTFTFLGSGGDSFTAFNEGTLTDTGLLDIALFRDYIQDNSPLSPDYARQQVFVEDYPSRIKAGDRVRFTAGIGETDTPVYPLNPKTLDLTSLGSPENTRVRITGARGDRRFGLGTVPVVDGIATIDFRVPAGLARGGVIELVAQPSGTTMTLPVVAGKLASTTRMKVRPAKVKVHKTRAKVRVWVRSGGEPAAGTVRVKAVGKVYRAKLNKKGSALVELKRFRGTGKKVVRVRYLGNGVTKPSRTSTTIRVVRR